MLKQSILFITAILVSGILFTGCSKDDNEDFIGNWVRENVFGDVPRTDAVSFTINGVAYIGTGLDIENDERLTDFWKYDATRETWEEVASLPAVGRNSAIAFGSDTKGYVGLGYDGDNALSDFWAYDPSTNTWEQKADFAGGKRYAAIGFFVDGKGYAGTGYDTQRKFNDFYSYDPATNSWEAKAVVPGDDKRRDAMSFVLNGEGYVIGGIGNSFLDNLCKYNPASDTWTKLNDIADNSTESFDDDYETIVRSNGVAFVLNGKAYVTTGNATSSNDTWEYDPAADRWKQKTDFQGVARTGAVAFTVNNKAFVAFGGTTNYSLDDVWSFNPDEEHNSRD